MPDSTANLKRIFVTGTAGFIGFHLSRLLLAEGFVVAGYDGMTDYYDVNLKRSRHVNGGAIFDHGSGGIALLRAA